MSRACILQLIASSQGGGATHVRELALALKPTRCALQVAMPEDGGHVHREDFAAAGIPFHQVDIAAGFSCAAFRHVRRLLAEVDIVHVHGARAAFFGRVAAASLGRKRPRVVYSIHGFAAPHYPHPRRDVLLTIERVLAPLTDRFVAVSEAERKALLTAGITRAEQVRVIQHGVDAARFHHAAIDRHTQRAALGIPLAARVITTICRLDKPRDFDTLLQAFRAVVETCPAAWLLIVGTGPYRPHIEALSRQLHVAARTTLAGLQRDIPRILAASDMLVLSTAQWEGLPCTILEAMAAGVPVVASTVGGIGEAVVHGETGRLVPPKNPPALAEALLRLLHDQESARRMGQQGRLRAEQLFTLERMTGDMVMLYEDVLNRS